MSSPSPSSSSTPASSPRLFALAWPLFLELCLNIAVGLIGTMLAARVSDASGAAFALANQLAATLFILFRIIGAGISVVITQSLGSGRRAVADATARAALGASSWIGGITALMAVVFAGPLLQLMNAPASVLPLSQPFLMALAPAMMLDAWNASMASVMRAHLRSRDTLMVLIVMQVAQLLLSVTLMPHLGLPGFALALFISRGLGMGLHVWLWRERLQLRPTWPDWWRLPRQELGAVLHIGLPGAAENIAYRMAYMVSIAVAGHLGASALAAHSYASQLMNFVLLPGLATGFAAEIVVGHLIGAGQLHEAHRLVRRALARGLAISVGVASVMAMASPWLLELFTHDTRIVSTAVILMVLTIVLEPGRTFNLVVINALRASGDARYPVMVGAGSMLVVLAGGSWLLGEVLGLGLVGVWIAYASDEWIRGLLMWRRWARLGWVPKARAVHRRLRRAHAH
ncbi:putative efflux protein, MATE family [Roseateles sp. YR242]|uniref:MATE family efflux transporter n=1 Tax=Roseateles sp. YR242 TaxID=1855305 RepID=UPI0008D4567F|nr:MATE family efflux transporter [Roseateles sp. YR242]SEK80783.1 putative efflux protein, MATE family [Roseateles sp. YR242]